MSTRDKSQPMPEFRPWRRPAASAGAGIMSGDVVRCAGCEGRVAGWALVPAIERDARPRTLCERCGGSLAGIVSAAAAQLDTEEGMEEQAALLRGIAFRLRGRS